MVDEKKAAPVYLRAFLGEDYSALAQLVEQMTVNHWVAGSSPAGGAIQKKARSIDWAFLYPPFLGEKSPVG